MALFVQGMRCPLCGLQIETGQDKILFAPFVANRRDPLHMFSDAVFHRSCFQNHPLAEEALRWHDRAQQHDGSGWRCVVCYAPITDPDDFFATGYLTADPSNPVFEFNYVELHRSHFAQWEKAAEFRDRMQMFLSSDVWEGPCILFDPAPRWLIAGR